MTLVSRKFRHGSWVGRVRPSKVFTERDRPVALGGKAFDPDLYVAHNGGVKREHPRPYRNSRR